MVLRKVSWALYIVGIGGILGSWIGLVAPGIGWIFWLMAMAGWGMQFLPGHKRSVLTIELQKLAQLHGSGELTDEEYEQAKSAVIGKTSS